MRHIRETEKRKTVSPVSTVRTLTLLLSGLMILAGSLLMLDQRSCTGFSGLVMILFGLVRGSGYFIRDLYDLAYQYDLELGIPLITAGLLLFLEPGIFRFHGTPAVELLLLADALFRIRICQQARKFGIETWWLTLALAVLTAVLSTGAVPLTVLYPQKSLQLLGICLTAEGCLNCCIGLTMVSPVQGRNYKQKEREIE